LTDLWRRQRWAVLSAGGLLALALAYGGPAAVWTATVLGALEVSLSFDNAVLNATVLMRMSVFWQRMFLTVGIVVAVFGVRLVLPLALISATTSISPWSAWRLALHHPQQYQAAIEHGRPGLAAFGAVFLLLVAGAFFARTNEHQWLPMEAGARRILSRRLTRWGVAGLTFAGAVGLGVSGHMAVAAGGFGGALGFAAISILSRRAGSGIGTAAAAGIGSFLYLELLDASVSVDGVMGAFAITTDVVVMAIGLGIGALFVRSMTMAVVRSRTLLRYRYLEHGAYYAIGMLGLILAISIVAHVPGPITSSAGIALIGAALASSILANRSESKQSAPLDIASSHQASDDALEAPGPIDVPLPRRPIQLHPLEQGVDP
jgi:hypothetical protein